MIRALLLAGLVASPALAQIDPFTAESDPVLAETAAHFRGEDVRDVTDVVATVALVYDATGAFPTTAFEVLGSQAADQTGLRREPLSDFSVSRGGDGVVVRYVPLPVDPYVREDLVVSVAITRGDDGLFTGAYEILRQSDPDEGGERLPYDVAGRYRVLRGYGTACVDVATVRERIAAGTYSPEPGSLGPSRMAIRVHPLGEETPVYSEEAR
jgi:hypothetical protein